MSRYDACEAVAEMHWALMVEIEVLEELLVDARQHAETDDGLAVLAAELGEALRLRRRALRGNRGAAGAQGGAERRTACD